MNLISWYPVGYCTYCNTKDSLVLEIGHNTSINASKYNKDLCIDIKSCNLHCKNCNKDFIIEWREGYPYPLRKKSVLSKFLQCFKQCNK